MSKLAREIYVGMRGKGEQSEGETARGGKCGETKGEGTKERRGERRNEQRRERVEGEGARGSRGEAEPLSHSLFDYQRLLMATFTQHALPGGRRRN